MVLFLQCLWPRLAFAALFSWMGYYGTGGDALAYHVLGLYARQLFGGAPVPLEDLVARWWIDEEPLDLKYGELARQVEEGFTLLGASTTLPIIGAHALIYLVVPAAFAFVAVTSVLSAWANVRLIREAELTQAGRLLLIYNPASIYFAATHYKEGIAEFLVIFFSIELLIRHRYWRAASWGAAVLLFRPSYVPIVALMALAPLLRRVDMRVVAIAVIIGLVAIPGLQWQLPVSDTELGPIYYLVYLNEFTQRVLGLLVGFLVPAPILLSFSRPFDYAMLFYGLVYWFAMAIAVIAIVRRARVEHLIFVPVMISLMVGYFVVGDAAAKARFYAPFFPLLLAGISRVIAHIQWTERPIGPVRAQST